MAEFDRIKNMNKKKGVFSGRYAIHPLTGEHVPIWIGNFRHRYLRYGGRHGRARP